METILLGFRNIKKMASDGKYRAELHVEYERVGAIYVGLLALGSFNLDINNMFRLM